MAEEEMIITSYGLFWRADEVAWFPGYGRKFALYGRRGKNIGTIQITDFWRQEGIYILYGNYGSYYAGLTKHLGYRLRDHQKDGHKGLWDRFSWFGFRHVLGKADCEGVHLLGKMPTSKPVTPRSVIKDLEALVIASLAVDNKNGSNFTNAKEWKQIKEHEVDGLLAKL
jgi:hypothetical protein